MEFKPCIVIPVFNHKKPLPGVINQLKQYKIPCLLIDDGSEQDCADVIQEISQQEAWVLTIIHPHNLGKGAAIKSGLSLAETQGYSHVLQIDADGQHDLVDVSGFLEQAREHPACIIIGQAVFDVSIPKMRYYGRYLTHIWVWLNTLSFQLKDTMCGFRVYPVVLVNEFLHNNYTGDRMEFDIEILVKLFRQQVCVESIPTKVNYPEDGLSHFRLWKDNVLISRMHASLFFSLLTYYLPKVIKQKLFYRR
ncbi:MAG: glycosyltransferase family 2 protein [Methylococcales bacterium]